MINKVLWTLCLQSACSTFLVAQTPDWSAAISQSDQLLSDLNTNTGPGCAVGAIHEGQYVYARSFGMANLEHDIPITSSSVFRIASMTKQITAAVIALLAEKKLIDLDADIHTYLPDLADYGTKVTVRQIIHHISGLPHYFDDAAEAAFQKIDGTSFRFGNEDYYTSQEFYDRVKTIGLHAPPETEFHYSSIAYFLLSRVVESVTGESMRQFADREIFSKLGMTHSFFNDNVNGVVKRRADGYRSLDGGTYEIYMTNMSWVGGDGVFTSLDDFIKWDRNFTNNVIGDEGAAFIETLETPHIFFEGADPAYAWGMYISAYRDHKLIFHGGSSVGFRTLYSRYPELNLSFVWFCNSDGPDASRKMAQFEDIYLDAVEGASK